MSSREPAERALPPTARPPSAGVAAPVDDPAPPPTVSISSESLFRGASEVRIAHGGSVYRLKQTALGKLILTK